MPHTVSIICPHCHAPWSGEPSPAGRCQCTYCGSTFSVVGTVAPPVAPASPRQLASRPVRSRGARLAVGALGALLGLALLAGAVWLRSSRLPRSSSPVIRPRIASPVVTPVVTPEAAPEVKPTAEFTHHRTVHAHGTTQYVFGVVKNTCRIAIEKPKVTVVLRDGSGRELDTQSAYAERDGLLPGESSPVFIILSKPPAFASLSFETVARKAYVEPRRARGLRLESRPLERNAIGWLVFKGKVHNSGPSTARFVRVRVTALDAEGKVVGLASGYVEGDPLAVGATARYEIMVHFPAQAARHQLEVEGRPVD